MTNTLRKISRIDFDAVDANQISRILNTGDLSALTPAERDYFDLMELVRGLNARMMLPGGQKIVTKAGIIKILKSPTYGLTDWMARRVYADALNFFYCDDSVRPRAWAGVYADRLDRLAALATAQGNLKEARGYITEAAKLRGCYDDRQDEIPRELLDARPVVVYTSDPESMGAPKADRRALEAFIDSIPEIPEISRARVKEDAGILPRDLLGRIESDIKVFGNDEE